MNKMMSAADPKLKTNFRLEFRSGSCVKVFFAKQQQTLHLNLYHQFCKIKETIFLSLFGIFVGSFLAWALTAEDSSETNFFYCLHKTSMVHMHSMLSPVEWRKKLCNKRKLCLTKLVDCHGSCICVCGIPSLANSTYPCDPSQIALWKHKVTAKAGTSYLCSMNVTRVSALMTHTYTMIDGHGSLEYTYCTEREGGRKSSSWHVQSRMCKGFCCIHILRHWCFGKCLTIIMSGCFSP